MVAPYVDEEIRWSIEKHEALRYFADESVGYRYPEAYIGYFGADYHPPDYISREYQAARQHRWYMTSRLITINDIYSFDPNVVVDFDEFEDVIGRNFRQPAEGLGFDGSAVAHMWRTMIWPNNSCRPRRLYHRHASLLRLYVGTIPFTSPLGPCGRDRARDKLLAIDAPPALTAEQGDDRRPRCRSCRRWWCGPGDLTAACRPGPRT